jgi:hypothetical protein
MQIPSGVSILPDSAKAIRTLAARLLERHQLVAREARTSSVLQFPRYEAHHRFARTSWGGRRPIEKKHRYAMMAAGLLQWWTEPV